MHGITSPSPSPATPIFGALRIGRQSASALARPLLGALGVILVLAGSAPGAITPDAKPKDWPANPENHKVTIRREAGDKTAAKMIAAAEAARPDAQDLRKAIADDTIRVDASRWWDREELGIRIPFAVTGDAVAYYTRLVESYGKEDFKRYVEPSSRLDYHATAKYHPEFEHNGKAFRDVHVVTLSFSFSQNFAATTTEGMQFDKERTVILDATGKVLAIDGDGTTEAPILAI